MSHTRCQQGQGEGTLSETWGVGRGTGTTSTLRKGNATISGALKIIQNVLVLTNSPWLWKGLSPLLRMVLWWGGLPKASSVEQFQRWSQSWCWHSWMATWMPCRADAVTSGFRTHIRIWRLLRPTSLRHTE